MSQWHRQTGNMLRVDGIDQRIVSQLVADARSSYSEIGKAVGLSAPAVKRRVDRLLDTGVLRGFTAVVNPEALGWGTEAFVEVHCIGNVRPDRIRARLLPLTEVVAAYTVSGAADAIVHLRAANIHHLEDALERLRAVDMIDRTVSTVVLSTLLERPPAPDVDR
jgi:DNA-binding Lrp family transcriptional regulator